MNYVLKEEQYVPLIFKLNLHIEKGTIYILLHLLR